MSCVERLKSENGHSIVLTMRKNDWLRGADSALRPRNTPPLEYARGGVVHSRYKKGFEITLSAQKNPRAIS